MSEDIESACIKQATQIRIVKIMAHLKLLKCNVTQYTPSSYEHLIELTKQQDYSNRRKATQLHLCIFEQCPVASTTKLAAHPILLLWCSYS